MFKERIEAARPIAEKINEVEKSLNLTLLQMGELMSSIAAARLAPGTRFALTAGIDASEKLIAAAAATSQGYRDIVEAHGHLAVDRGDANLPATAWGPMGCPPELAESDIMETSHLKAVVNS